MKLVILWTDAMIWLLLLALLFWAFRAKSDQVRQQWQAIFRSSIAVMSSVVLSIYVLFALLDSVHFKVPVNTSTQEIHYSSSLVSGLDLIFSHIKKSQECTYSSPFATHEYSLSIINSVGKVSKQVYLPLNHVDASVSITFLGMKVFGSIMVLLLLVEFLFFRRRKKSLKPRLSAYIIIWLFGGLLLWGYFLSFSYHVLGTDKVGQDIFLQTLKSIRTGVLIGTLTTLIMLPLALVLGISAGYFKGKVDDIIQYIYTTLSSIPSVLLIAAMVLMTQVLMENNPEWFSSSEQRSDLRLLFIILVLGVTSWTGLCRLLRAETLKVSQLDYVNAARTFGIGNFKIIFSHILPNLMHIVLISIVLDFSGLVLSEAVLSYVGIGVDPTMNSWGNMINQSRLELAREPVVWWPLLSAFIFMFVLVLSANLFSDRVQAVLDPRNIKN